MQLRFAQLGYPIRKSPYHSLFPTPRSLSQVIASFIDFQTQGIHQILLLSYPAVPLARQLEHQRYVHSGPLVLRAALINIPTPTSDRDRTVSRRSEPSSRTALIGEQPNPWNRLQLQDAMSRHRGAKPSRRCDLLGKISLLSPG